MYRKDDYVNEVEDVMKKESGFVSEELAEELVKTEPSIAICACALLNIRNQPTKNSEIVCQIERGSEVVIDKDGSDEEWAKVFTGFGTEGFCMKEFLLYK